MDASLMTDDGRFAAVAVIERVKNPVRVARAVLDSPHVLLAGEGATRFAHRMGFEDVVPESEPARQSYRRRLEAVKKQLDLEEGADWPALWNFPNPLPPELRRETDTVGTVVRDGEGRFAATLSTGGTSVTLDGRVGDVPIYGAGLFAGPAGAVACTGVGEVIVRESLARTVYEALAAEVPVKEAVHRAVAAFPEGAAVGIIAVDRHGWAVGASEPMAYGVAPSPP
jgi:beta-aspartyl-peptidase (threonine type)